MGDYRGSFEGPFKGTGVPLRAPLKGSIGIKEGRV